jgi:phosphoribosyl 1,2-cyclic phosphodiesterase
MTSQTAMSVKFWGVRGSIACPGAHNARYGGNTSCVEVRCGGRVLIFDAGSGLRELGKALAAGPVVDADIFLSHCHLDHIVGFPFFAPLYSKEASVRLWAGHLLPDRKLEQVVGQMMAPPLFPISYDVFKAKVEFRDFVAGETLTPCGGVLLRTLPLNHPQGATGYRLESLGRSIAYVTDNEPMGEEPDPLLVAFLSGVDVLVYDCTYTDEEYRTHVGWGHSSWTHGLRVAAAAGAKTFCIFHHDPDHDDAALAEIETQARRLRAGSVVAREGLVLSV